MKGFTCNFEEGKVYRSTNGRLYKLVGNEVYYSPGEENWLLSHTISLDDKFEEIKYKPKPKQVTWQEALQAWANGKTITCVHACQNFIFHGNQRLLIAQIGGSLAKEDLTKGLWFIEEDVK